MTPIRIFVSSVHREFSQEREHLRDYLRGDPLMRRFFEVFLFEDMPASDRRPDKVCLAEVDRCDIYVGLFGADYGFEDAEGISPTEREYDRATEQAKHRLIFLKGDGGVDRHPKMRALIRRARAGLVRRRFATSATQEREGSTDSGSPRDRIVALLRSDPTLTRIALASRVGLTPEGVKYHLDKLRRAGRIRHVGPTKKGRWEVLEREAGP